MKLLLDIGNNRMRWAFLGPDGLGAGLSHRGEVLHAGSPFAPLVNEAWMDFPQPDAILASNVAGTEFAGALSEWTLATWGETPEFVVPTTSAFGVTNGYSDPEQLGPDRWAALVAVRHEHPGTAIVVDCGTAVTVDAMDAEGRHLGGLILPGLGMMRRCLAERTQSVEVGDPGAGDVGLLACDTQDAVVGGTLYALVAAVERITGDLTAELNGDALHVMTGGEATAVLALLGGEWRHDPDLVLRGLAVMAEGR